MKISSLFILLIVPLTLSAQNNEHPLREQYDFEKPSSRAPFRKLKGADTDTPVLDSLHIYRFDSDLHEKKMYHYNDKNYLIRVETFFRVLYLEQPYDLAFFIEEYDWDEAGNKIWDRHLAWDIDNLTADDYLVRHHYEYEFDKAGNQTFESVKEWNYDTRELENKVRQYAEFNQNGDQVYLLKQNGRRDEWLNNYLNEKEFFADGKLKSEKRLNGDANGNWETGDFHHYDEYVGNIFKIYILQKWSADLQDWVNHQLTERILDDNGLQDIAYMSNWDAGKEEWWHTHILYFTYDEHMILDEIIYVARENPGDEFTNFLWSIYKFNGSDMWTGNLQLRWDNNNEKWVNSRNYVREYNEQGLRTYDLSQTWDPAKEVWLNNTSNEYEFDDQGRQTWFLMQIYDRNTGALSMGQRGENKYNNAGLLLLSTIEIYSTQYGVWYGGRYMVYEYDESNRMTLYEMKQNQHPQTQKWSFGRKFVYDYDLNGHLSEETEYHWDTNGQAFAWHNTKDYLNDWYGNIRWCRSTNPSAILDETWEGFVTYTIDLAIQSQGSPLEGVVLTLSGDTYVSDENGEISFSVTCGKEMRYEYTLEKQGYSSVEGDVHIDRNISELITMSPLGTTTYKVSFYISWGTDWLPNARVTLSGYGEKITDAVGRAIFINVAPKDNIPYSVTYNDLVYEGTLDVTDEDESREIDMKPLRTELLHGAGGIRLYPVPAGDFVILELGILPYTGNRSGLPGAYDPGMQSGVDVKIFDVRGSLVLEQFCTGERHTLNISHLPAGIYYVRITNGNETIVKKMVVR